MISTDIVFRRGILFVRIRKNNDTKNDEMELVCDLVKKIGIKYMVLNFSDDLIDNDFKIRLIINNYRELMKVSGKLFLCGNVDITMYNNLGIDRIDYEKEAFQRM